MRRLRLIISAVAASIAFAEGPAPSRASAVPRYVLVQKLRLGGQGGWDYLTLDAAARRLYIARANRVQVLDADAYAVLGHVRKTEGVHGVAVAPEFGRGFASDGRSDRVAVFDLKTLKTVAEVPTGEGPDAILYDPASKRVFAFNGRSADATAIDAAGATVAGTLSLGGKPEFAAVDGHGTVFVNLEDRDAVVAFDSLSLKVKNTWALAPCRGPSAMAVDAGHRRLFVGCRNRRMAVVDADSGRVVTALPIGGLVDAAGFDAELGLAFSSNGDGTLTVIREESPDDFQVAQTVRTQPGARTMALDPATHRVFLVTAAFGPAPAATADNPRPRPPVLPGTFTLLVYGPEKVPSFR